MGGNGLEGTYTCTIFSTNASQRYASCQCMNNQLLRGGGLLYKHQPFPLKHSLYSTKIRSRCVHLQLRRCCGGGVWSVVPFHQSVRLRQTVILPTRCWAWPHLPLNSQRPARDRRCLHLWVSSSRVRFGLPRPLGNVRGNRTQL